MGWLTRLFSKRSLDDRLLAGELSPETSEGRKRAERLVSRRHRAHSALMEFDTMIRHNLPIVAAMGNNGIWALEHHPMKCSSATRSPPSAAPRPATTRSGEPGVGGSAEPVRRRGRGSPRAR